MTSTREREAYREARALIRNIPPRTGVEDVFLGARYRDGGRTGEQTIRFHVQEKRSLRYQAVSERIPKRIGRFATDVTGMTRRNQARTEPPFILVSPLLGGVQIQSAAFDQPLDWGTLGCVLTVRDRPFCISNYHVIFDPAAPVPDQTVFQPKRSSFGEKIGVSSGTLSDPDMDYALFSPTRPHDPQQHLNGIAGMIAGYKQAAGLNELRVFKTGAASGLTEGVYDGRSLFHPFRVSIGRASVAQTDGSAPGAGKKHEQPHPTTRSASARLRTPGDPARLRAPGDSGRLSAPGDSGSVWVTAGEQPGLLRLFALHTGGDEEGNMAFATLFSSIIPSLNAKLNNL